MNTKLRITTAVVGFGLITGALTGCVDLGTKAKADRPAPTITCDQAPDLSKKPITDAILGELGTTAAKHYADDVSKVIDGAKTTKAHVLVNGIGSDANAPSLVADTVFTPDGENDTARDENITCKTKLVTDAIAVLAKQPNPQPLDVFSAIYTLYGNLKGTPAGAEINVVLLSSLLNNSRLANLSHEGTLKNVTQTLNTLAAAKLKPDCTGWRVTAVSDSSADAVEDAALREFWRSYFDWCGGALVAWTSHLSQFPVQGDAVKAADTTQIPIVRDPGKIIATLSGDVTFDDGKADLRLTAEAELKQILQLTDEEKGGIQIDGYTDVDTGEGPKWLKNLSDRRADAVRAWLVTHGVPAKRISAAGHGASDFVYKNPRTPSQHASNRRVVVTVYAR
jgi:outer membrane protein OmpA-like peptidoglycan-associated protein